MSLISHAATIAAAHQLSAAARMGQGVHRLIR